MNIKQEELNRMSLKRNIQVLAAVAAVFAFSAIAASSALAAGDAPRFTISGVTPTSGATAFTGTSTGGAGGTGQLEVPGLFNLTNPGNECTTSGNVVGSAANTSGTATNVVLKCHNVDIEGLPNCVVEDETDNIPGTVTTENLKGTGVWLAATGDRAGITFVPTTAGGPFAKLLVTTKAGAPEPCVFVGLTVKVEGSIVGEAETVGVDAVTQALNFPNPPITETWTNATPRVKVATADGLKVGGKAATFTNTFHITLTGSPSWGVETG
jgi:hypothetical protein